MYQLSCPHCQSVIAVSPSQAGDQTQCPSCGETVAIPRLRELRQLPQDEAQTASSDREAPPFEEPGFAQRIGTVALGLICTASLLIAGYCGIRWATIEVPMTTQRHVQEIREIYPTRNPAELLREYEQMEEASLELPSPYLYKKIQEDKDGWGHNAMIAGGISIFTLAGAIFFASSGRSRRP
ncbi:hypothetical protein Pla52o_44290 [Novipirellula galeiformis]|uniref:Uncharacterized protein n=1 Tax=Novipirellula galeiformis TaxID=2528004 RepID=A0A5C6CAP6_9BACT|nr:hypothetical protein [Novipirellula galeiformis]TWU20551.1 hypothetical protein Pla52o_44290 [Novipirellula galeiformis]